MSDRIRPGMDHALYPFSALPDRRPMALPDGKKVAVAPVVHLEDWTLDPPAGAVADPRFGDVYGVFQPDYRTHSWREYGLRIGIFRVFEVLDKCGLKATLAVNASVARRCPVLIVEALARGWEIAAHGEYANAMITSAMSPSQIRDHVAGCLDTLESLTGSRPQGWVAQDFGESADTPQILAELGIRWIANWPNDEQPYFMTTDPPITSVPVLSELDDVELLRHRRVPAPRYPRLIEEAYSVLRRDGESLARVMVLGIHPWVVGMPHHIRYLEEAMTYISRQDTAWHTTCGGIATWYRHASQRKNTG
jgi:peptidoglycan/xylan/chitin deacetylase (PgdA/CDA1 family)